MANIFSEALINYLLHRADKTIILGFPDSIHFELDKDLTLKDLLDSYKAMKEELRKIKEDGQPWLTPEEKEEDGWQCVNFFCNMCKPGEPPKYCPICGMSNPVKVKGKKQHIHQICWIPTPESYTEAVKKELKLNEDLPKQNDPSGQEPSS